MQDCSEYAMVCMYVCMCGMGVCMACVCVGHNARLQRVCNGMYVCMYVCVAWVYVWHVCVCVCVVCVCVWYVCMCGVCVCVVCVYVCGMCVCVCLCVPYVYMCAHVHTLHTYRDITASYQ